MTTTISKDEVALYDRQIRLWGMDAQQRIMNARVLVINIGGIGAEICKNLVLAGIGHVTIADSHLLSLQDLSTNFLADQDMVGQNRGMACRANLGSLNPRVDIEIVPNALLPLEDDDDFIANFDLVIASNVDSVKDLIALNQSSRRLKKPFYCASCLGLYGYIFADLITHDFTIQHSSNVLVKQESKSRSIIKVDGVNVTKRELFNPLESVIASPTLSPPLSKRKLANVSPYLSLLFGSWNYQLDKNKEKPLSLESHIISASTSMGIPTPDSSTINHFIHLYNTPPQISPMAAIIAGVTSQNIIDFFAKNRQPIQNLAIFDSFSPITGLVYTIGF